MECILEVRNLVKKYGEVTAVKGVSFEIRDGEIFSLLGPNGAGKTTTISVLSTLYRATSGDATIAGHSVTREPMAVRRLIGVVPQELALYDELTARENLAFWGQMYNLGGAALNTRIGEVLEQIGLADRANQRVKTFSGGMKRRVNIGVGLLHRPRLLFMDEPTVGIDPQSRRAILDSVKDLNKQGMTVLYTTHYMEEAQELSDRVGIIDHGELIALGTQAELRQQVGESDAIVLHIGEGEAVGPALADAIRGVEGVSQAQLTDGTITVITPGAEDVLAPVITACNAYGVKLRSVEIEEPDLEAVFLHLTGRALRELRRDTMKKILLIGWKDVKLAFRDRAGLLLTLAAPFLLIVGLGFVSGRVTGNSAGIEGIAVVLVNQDEGQLGRSLVETFQSADLAELVAPAVLTDPVAARSQVDADKAAAALIIPPGFTAGIIPTASGPAVAGASTGPAVPIEFYANPTSPTSAEVIRTIAEQFLGQVEVGRITGEVAVRQMLESGRIQPKDAARVGAAIGARQAVASGETARATVNATTNGGGPVTFDPLALMAPSMALMFLMFGAALGGRSLLTERNQGTLPRLLVSPIKPSQVLAGKTIGTFLTCVAQMSILILASALLFGLRWGDSLAVLALIVAAAFAATAWGMLIAGLAHTPGQVTTMGSAITLLFGILGGAFIDRSAMPPWYQIASKITPNAWGLDGFTTLALGGRLADILLPIGALLVMGVVVLGMALAALQAGRKESGLI